MGKITEYLQQILSARYGRDVRQSIHDAIEEINGVATTAQDSATASAKTATDKANTATDKANEAIKKAEEALESAEQAKYYAEKAESITGYGFATEEKQGIIRGGENHIDEDGTLQLTKTTDQTTLPNSHSGRVLIEHIGGNMEQFSTTGAQLFDETLQIGYRNTIGGDLVIDTGVYRTIDFIIEEAGDYTFSFGIAVRIIRLDGEEPQTNVDGTEFSYTFEAGEHYISFRNLINTNWDSTVEIMLNTGTEALPYEPYTGGIPSPNLNYPQEIKCVTGKNLLDCRGISERTLNGVSLSIKYDDNGNIEYMEVDGTPTQNTALIIGGANQVADLIRGEKYILNGCPSGGSGSTYQLQFFNPDGNNSFAYDKGSGVEFTFNPIAENYNVTIYVYSGQTFDHLRFYPMIRPASVTDDTYVPYGLIRIKGHGKNFVNVSDKTFTNNTYFAVDMPCFLPKGTYTVHAKCDSVYNIATDFYVADANKNNIFRLAGVALSKFVNSNYQVFTIDEDCYYLTWYVNNTAGYTFTISDFSIMEGDTGTYYEPYTEHSITLSKPMEWYGNDIARDLLTPREIERKYKKVVFNGSNYTTDLSLMNGYNRFRIVNILNGMEKPANKEALDNFYCDSFVVVGNPIGNNAIDNACAGYVSNDNLYIRADQFSTVEEFNAHFAEHPMTVVYPLAEPATESLPIADQIALNSLLSYDGITYVEFDTEVQPTWKAKYGTSEVGAKALEAYANAQIAQITNADDAEDIQQLQEEVKSHATKLKAHSNSLTSLSKENVYRQNDISDTNSRIDTLQSSVNTNTDDIANLKSASSASIQNINTLQGQVNTMGQTVSANVGDIKLLQNQAHTHSRTVLWTNSDKTQEITSVQNLFSMSIEAYEQYEFYLITYYTATNGDYPTRQELVARAADYGNGTNVKLSGFLKYGEVYCYHERAISYSHDSQAWKVSGCNCFDASGATQTAHDKLIPYQIIGIK